MLQKLIFIAFLAVSDYLASMYKEICIWNSVSKLFSYVLYTYSTYMHSHKYINTGTHAQNIYIYKHELLWIQIVIAEKKT